MLKIKIKLLKLIKKNSCLSTKSKMASTDQVTIDSILINFEETLEFSRLQIQGDLPHQNNDEFNSELFWTNFNNASKLISHEATKLGMVFDGSERPSPESCKSLIDNTQKFCLSLLAVFVKLPRTRGKLLYARISEYVRDILGSMKNVSIALRTHSDSRLQKVGDLWELCASCQNLPRDERDCLVNLCQEQLNLVEDASQELAETILEHEESQSNPEPPLPNGFNLPPIDNWTPSDVNVLLPCSGLLKALKACIKKTMETVKDVADGNNEAAIAELDQMADYMACGSELADDFVAAVYPPVDHSELRQKGMLIRNNCKALLENVRNSHLFSSSVERWLDFLEKAVDHNWVRINDMVLAD